MSWSKWPDYGKFDGKFGKTAKKAGNIVQRYSTQCGKKNADHIFPSTPCQNHCQIFPQAAATKALGQDIHVVPIAKDEMHAGEPVETGEE